MCEDESGLRETLGVLLNRAGYVPSLAPHVAAALRQIETGSFAAVLSDLLMPDGSGMIVLDAARARDQHAQVIMMTAYATTEQAVEAMRRGAYDYIQKPFKHQELLATIEKALEKRRILDENSALRQQLHGGSRAGGLLGKSAAMKRVMELVSRVANAPSSVLITGESGTGKEMVARALHDGSDRREKSFVAVNCGALPETLMESELFGYEKGAFTGAAGRKDGLFRAADRGTLFLDEIGELTPRLQVKLLRALQERKIRPLGSEQEVAVDVRVVAATNRDVEQEVAAGTFRSDLFYRLNVIRIAIPPLRERLEDIAILADHFVHKYCILHGRQLHLSSQALRWLVQQAYPGNVRQLENIIERAITLSDGPQIEHRDLTESSAGASIRDDSLSVADQLSAIRREDLGLDDYLATLEKQLILRALEESQGVRTAAAKRLGMSFRSLRYRLAKYGLSSEEDDEDVSE